MEVQLHLGHTSGTHVVSPARQRTGYLRPMPAWPGKDNDVVYQPLPSALAWRVLRSQTGGAPAEEHPHVIRPEQVPLAHDAGPGERHP